MGIKQLMKFICDHAPSSVSSHPLPHYLSRIIAIDASMSLYQLLIAVRQGADQQWLSNDSGEVTSHIQGFFYRTLRLMEAGIKPVFVFDGAAPEAKKAELNKRAENREAVYQLMEAAKEAGNQEEINKLQRRSVRVTREHNEDVKQLLRLMGIPVIESPSEAEAQCAAMCKAGLVYAVGTEDMDALTFGTPKLLRALLSASSQSKKDSTTKSSNRSMNVKSADQHIITEVQLKSMLKEIDLTHDEFIHLCILMGCDYCPTIKGLGPASAYKLIKQHHSIEAALKEIEKSGKYKIPEDFNYSQAAELFKNPLTADCSTMKLEWKNPDEAGLIEFLVQQKGFSEERVKTGLARLKKSKSASSQQRMDSFFKIQSAEVKDKPKAVDKKNGVTGKKNPLTGTKAIAPQAKKTKL